MSARAAGPRRRQQRPEGVEAGALITANAGGLLLVHLLALLALLPSLFSWAGVIALVLSTVVFGQAITLGYHRLLTHRSFAVPKWLERTIVVLAACCLQDAPSKWACWHRLHHAHSDQRADPHSPRVGFWWAHFLWVVFYNPASSSLAVQERYARDILADPFYRLLEARRDVLLGIYILQAPVYFAIGVALGRLGGADWGAASMLGASVLVWGMVVRTVLVLHITWSVNSLTHMFGYQSHDTGDDSRNYWLVALITQGEGWHNNHHADQASACNRHRWWEIDNTWTVIWILERLGLATEVRRPFTPKRTA